MFERFAWIAGRRELRSDWPAAVPSKAFAGSTSALNCRELWQAKETMALSAASPSCSVDWAENDAFSTDRREMRWRGNKTHPNDQFSVADERLYRKPLSGLDWHAAASHHSTGAGLDWPSSSVLFHL